MENNIIYLRKIYKIHDYSQLLIFIMLNILILLYLIPRKCSNGYIIDLIKNWKMKPITSFNPEIPKINNSNYYLNEQLGLGQWEGIVNSCNCLLSVDSEFSNQLFRKKCNKKMLKSGCENIEKIFPVSYSVWKGILLNPIISNDNLSYIDYLKDYSNFDCEKNFNDCGYLDSNYGIKLCLPKTKKCPINHIYIDKIAIPEYSIYNYTNIKLNDEYYLHYTNEKKNGIVLVQLKISELMPCGNALNENRKEMEYLLYSIDKFKCEDNVEDYRFFELDYENKSVLYLENKIFDIVNNLPLYEFKDNNQQIFYRGYIGLTHKIKIYHSHLIFFEHLKHNLTTHNLIRLLIFLILILIILFSIKENNKRGYNIKMFRRDIIIRIILEIGMFLTLYNSFYLFLNNKKIYYLLFHISPITSLGTKKIFNNITLFYLLDFYIICILIFLLFFNPFFLLSGKIAKCFPQKKNDNQLNNQSSINVIGNHILDINNNSFAKIKKVNDNIIVEKSHNEIINNPNDKNKDIIIDEKQKNEI